MNEKIFAVKQQKVLFLQMQVLSSLRRMRGHVKKRRMIK
jgi:hypothetical protein